MQERLAEYAQEISKLKEQLKPPAAPAKSSVSTVKSLNLQEAL